MPLARIISSTLREVEHFGLCQITVSIAHSWSRPWRTADIDGIAVSARSVGGDPARDEYPPVERNDLAVLRRAGRIVARADEILAATRAFYLQFLRFLLVGQMHGHAAGRPGTDDVRLLALITRRCLGTRPVIRTVI